MPLVDRRSLIISNVLTGNAQKHGFLFIQYFKTNVTVNIISSPAHLTKTQTRLIDLLTTKLAKICGPKRKCQIKEQ